MQNYISVVKDSSLCTEGLYVRPVPSLLANLQKQEGNVAVLKVKGLPDIL